MPSVSHVVAQLIWHCDSRVHDRCPFLLNTHIPTKIINRNSVCSVASKPYIIKVEYTMRGGAISGVIRFACHVPLGFYSSYALKHWKFVKHNAGVLLEPPLSHKIQVGEQFAGPWVCSLQFCATRTHHSHPPGYLRVCLELCHVDTDMCSSRTVTPIHGSRRRLDSHCSDRRH